MTGTADARAVAEGLGLERVPFGSDCEQVHLATPALQRREQLVEKLLLGPGRLVAVVDAAGAGKSTLLRRALARLGDRVTAVQMAASATLGPEAALRRLTDVLDAQANRCPATGLAAMRKEMAERAAAGRLTVVAVDDADRLTAGAVEVLVTLASRWADDGLRLVLCGRPALVPAIVELVQDCRVPIRFVDVPALEVGEVGDLIHLHLHGAGLRGDSPFDAAEVRRIARAAGGRPGRVGPLAMEVLAAHVRPAGATRLRRRWMMLAAAGAVLAGVGAGLNRGAFARRGETRPQAREPSGQTGPFRSSIAR